MIVSVGTQLRQREGGGQHCNCAQFVQIVHIAHIVNASREREGGRGNFAIARIVQIARERGGGQHCNIAHIACMCYIDPDSFTLTILSYNVLLSTASKMIMYCDHCNKYSEHNSAVSRCASAAPSRLFLSIFPFTICVPANNFHYLLHCQNFQDFKLQ